MYVRDPKLFSYQDVAKIQQKSNQDVVKIQQKSFRFRTKVLL